MNEKELKLLIDIKSSCNLIKSFSTGKTFAEYKVDPYFRSAIERQFEIVGEALNRLQKMGSPIVKSISEYEKIISFRNIIIHAYDNVDQRLYRNN